MKIIVSNRRSAVLSGVFATLTLLLVMDASATLPEAIAPTNTLPPTAGTYVIWPPETLLKFDGTMNYLGTNYPTWFHLQQIEVGPFTNVVRTVDGNDLLLEFDAFMSTHIPYVNLAGTVLTNAALYDQTGHFRIRVHGGNTPVSNRLRLTLEAFSWTYQARMNEVYYDFIHVRNQTNQVSSGWIEFTRLSDGSYVQQSELQIWPEGVMLPSPGMNPPFVSDYIPVENGPIRLVLKGISRTLEILHVACADEGKLQIHGSYLGPDYLYGLEYTTNGTAWMEYTVPTGYGDSVSWFEDTEAWRWNFHATNAPMTWFRLKAKPWP